jgi:hypothetical protein
MNDRMRMRAARVAGGRFFCCMAVAGGVRACEESLVGSGLEGWRWLGFICELKMIFAINLYGNTGENYPTQIWEPRIRLGNSPNCFYTRCILVFPLVFQFFLKNDTIDLCGVGGRWTGRRMAEEGRRDSCRWRRKRGHVHDAMEKVCQRHQASIYIKYIGETHYTSCTDFSQHARGSHHNPLDLLLTCKLSISTSTRIMHALC